MKNIGQLQSMANPNLANSVALYITSQNAHRAPMHCDPNQEHPTETIEPPRSFAHPSQTNVSLSADVENQGTGLPLKEKNS